MLNKGGARNALALARPVFFNRPGEIRDRSFEQQRYRASGLNLMTAAVVLWNTVYLERSTNALRGHGQTVDDALLQHLSPLGWENIGGISRNPRKFRHPIFASLKISLGRAYNPNWHPVEGAIDGRP